LVCENQLVLSIFQPLKKKFIVLVSGSGIHPQDEIIQVVDQRSQIREEHIEKVLAPGTSQISIPELNPKPKGGTEAVANLDETLRLLQAHVSSLGKGLNSFKVYILYSSLFLTDHLYI